MSAVLVAGDLLLSAGRDGQLRRWPFPPQTRDARAADVDGRPLDAVQALACTIAGRNLSDAEVERYFPGEEGRPPTCG